MSLFDEKEENPILAELAQVDVYNMTPMQAMNLLLVAESKNYKSKPTQKTEWVSVVLFFLSQLVG